MALGPIDNRASVVLPQTDRPATMPRAATGSSVVTSVVTEPAKPPANAVEQARAAEQARREQVESAVRKANEVVQSTARDLEFTVDDSTGRTVIKVIDHATEEVIRQIPSEEMLAIAASIERLQGLLVKQEA